MGFDINRNIRKFFYINHVDLISHFDLLAMISLFGLLLLLSIHNSLHSVFALVFCLSFFLKGKHFVMLHKRFFHQIETQEEMTLYLSGPILSGSF